MNLLESGIINTVIILLNNNESDFLVDSNKFSRRFLKAQKNSQHFIKCADVTRVCPGITLLCAWEDQPWISVSNYQLCKTNGGGKLAISDNLTFTIIYTMSHGLNVNASLRIKQMMEPIVYLCTQVLL